MLTTKVNFSKSWVPRFFIHLYEKRWYAFRTEMPFQVFHFSHSYLRQFFITLGFLLFIGSPYIACMYFVINAALWLGYEDDMDEEEVFDDDMEGDNDWIWEEINTVAMFVMIVGLAIAEDETKVMGRAIMFDHHFDDHLFHYIRFIEIFHNHSKDVSVINVSFFISLCEWNNHLTEIFGHPLFSLVSNELETASLIDCEKIFNKSADTLFIPTNKKNYLSIYDRDANIETLNLKTNIEFFFFSLYYKFKILRNYVDNKVIYDLILSDLNNYFFKINKKNQNAFFFKHLLTFKKKLKNHNFLIKFNSYSLKFMVDDCWSSTNRFQSFKNSNKLRKTNFLDRKMLFFYVKRRKYFWKYPLYNNILLLYLTLRVQKHPYFLKKTSTRFIYGSRSFFQYFSFKKWRKRRRLRAWRDYVKERYELRINSPHIKLRKILRSVRPRPRIIKYADDKFKNPFLNLNKRKISFFEFKKQTILNPEFYKMRKRSFFWDHFYNIVDQIFIDPILDEEVHKASKTNNAAGYMSDHFISISDRKIQQGMVESEFLLAIIKYKPVLFDLKINKIVNSFADIKKLANNLKLKKAIERNLNLFINITYKDFLLTGACSYEQLWYSLGFYFPLLRMIIAHKLLYFIIKCNRKKKK